MSVNRSTIIVPGKWRVNNVCSSRIGLTPDRRANTALAGECRRVTVGHILNGRSPDRLLRYYRIPRRHGVRRLRLNFLNVLHICTPP